MTFGLTKGARAGARDRELSARSSAANGKGIALGRSEQPLVLETLQRGVDGADRVIAASARSEIAPDGEAVGVVFEARDREQDRELEGAQ